MDETTPDENETPELENEPGNEVEPAADPADEGADPGAEQPPADGEPPVELAREADGTFTLEFNGEKMEITREQAIHFARKGVQADDLLALLKEQPDFVLEKMGIDPYEWAENLLAGKLKQDLEDRKLSPDQRKIRDLERQLKEREQQELNAKEQAASDEYEKIALDAMKESNLPATPYVMALIVQAQAAALSKGKVYSAKTIGKIVERTLAAQRGENYEDDTYDGEKILAKMGPKALAKVEAALAARKNPRPPAPAQGQRPTQKIPGMPGNFTQPSQQQPRRQREEQPKRKASLAELMRPMRFAKD